MPWHRKSPISGLYLHQFLWSIFLAHCLTKSQYWWKSSCHDVIMALLSDWWITRTEGQLHRESTSRKSSWCWAYLSSLVVYGQPTSGLSDLFLLIIQQGSHQELHSNPMNMIEQIYATLIRCTFHIVWSFPPNNSPMTSHWVPVRLWYWGLLQ